MLDISHLVRWSRCVRFKKHTALKIGCWLRRSIPLGYPWMLNYLTAFCSTAAVVTTSLQFHDPVFYSGPFLLAPVWRQYCLQTFKTWSAYLHGMGVNCLNVQDCETNPRFWWHVGWILRCHKLSYTVFHYFASLLGKSASEITGNYNVYGAMESGFL